MKRGHFLCAALPARGSSSPRDIHQGRDSEGRPRPKATPRPGRAKSPSGPFPSCTWQAGSSGTLGLEQRTPGGGQAGGSAGLGWGPGSAQPCGMAPARLPGITKLPQIRTISILLRRNPCFCTQLCLPSCPHLGLSVSSRPRDQAPDVSTEKGLDLSSQQTRPGLPSS